jgi:NAD(P)-dependent dehydrogenase (short-subunit alcohol dehydrogenase family)
MLFLNALCKRAISKLLNFFNFYIDNNVKINIILPGNILMEKNNWSQKIKRNNVKIKKYIKENVPLNRFCSPEQISGICDYLLSKAGDNITGSKFIIDGGESL